MISAETIASHIRSSGKRGVSIDDLHVFLTGRHAEDRSQRSFARSAMRRASYCLPKGEFIDCIEPRTPRVRYLIGVEPSEVGAPLYKPDPIPSVTRIVTDVLGLGATPGARVSVPFVSFLDAAPPRASAGRGEG